MTKASAALAFAMLVVLLAVHIDEGLFMSNNGYKFNLALLATAASLLISGAGRVSLDQALVGRMVGAR